MAKETCRYYLHIGTVKVAFLKVVFHPDGRREVEKARVLPADGFEGGIVKDLAKAAETLYRLRENVCVGTADTLISCRIVLSNAHLKNFTFSSSIYYHGNAHELTMKDVCQVIAQTRSVATIPLNEMIIQAIPQEFLVDNLSGISNPIGLQATRLGVTLLLFTTDYAIYHNLLRALERADLEAREIIPVSLASAQAVLTPADRQEGVVVVDLGGYASYFSCFKDSVLVESSLVPGGSEAITEVIARTANVRLEEARRLKETFVSIGEPPGFSEELIPVQDRDQKATRHLPYKEFRAEILSAIQEYVSSLISPLRVLVERRAPVSQVVLTGGAAKMDGLLEAVQESLACTVRLGIPKQISGDQSIVTDPSFSGVLGAVDFSSIVVDPSVVYEGTAGSVTRLVHTAKRWISEYF